MKDKKKLAMLILGLNDEGKAKSDEMPHIKSMKENEESDDPEMGLKAAAEDVMEAVKNEDAEMFVKAMKSFIAMCDEE